MVEVPPSRTWASQKVLKALLGSVVESETQGTPAGPPFTAPCLPLLLEGRSCPFPSPAEKTSRKREPTPGDSPGPIGCLFPLLPNRVLVATSSQPKGVGTPHA